MRAFLALVAAGWQVNWNRGARSIWIALLQMGLGALALWRLRPAATLTGGEALLTMAAQAGGWACLAAFLAGRRELYGGRTLALIHASAAPPLAPVAAQVIAGLPRRAWSMLLWAIGLGAVAGRWGMPALWVVGMAVGSLGELAGLLVLVAWVRLAPRSLGAAWAATLVAMIGLLWYGLFYVAVGDLPRAVAGVRQAVVGAAALPGLFMLLWLALAPARLGAAYREGWLRLAELADGSSRPRRSRWPAALPGPAGAVLAKDWLLLLRNPATWFRLGALALLAVALIPARPYLPRLHGDWLVIGAGLGAAWGAFGEVAAAGFSAEGHRLGLAAAAGVGPAQLLLGKLAGVAPLGLLSALGAWAVALALGLPASEQLRLAAWALAGGVGMAAIAAGGAAFDAAAIGEPAEAEEAEAILAAVMEQVPRGVGGTAGLIGSAVWAAAWVWLPGAGVRLALAVIPLLFLLAARWRLATRVT